MKPAKVNKPLNTPKTVKDWTKFYNMPKTRNMKEIGKGWGGEPPAKPVKSVKKTSVKKQPTYSSVQKSLKKTMGY